jgi:hypothetical protein
MPQDAFRSLLTGAPPRAAKRWHSKNLRWMHLGTRDVMTRNILQGCWALHSVSATNSIFLAGYAIALWLSFGGPIPAAMQQMIGYLFAWAGVYAQLLTRWNLMDECLFDIPLVEYLYCREFQPRLHLRLGNLRDNRTAMKMTGFLIAQLRTLYGHFGLQDFVHVHHKTELLIGTDTFHLVTGKENC